MNLVNRLESNIATYIKRREALRDQYGPSYKNSKEYSNRVNRLTRTIRNMRKRLYRVRVIFERLVLVDKKVAEFFGVKPFKGSLRLNPHSRHSGPEKLARAMFYKYAIESTGIRPYYVSYYAGASFADTASTTRLRLTRRFATNPELRATYHRLKKFCSEVTLEELQEAA